MVQLTKTAAAQLFDRLFTEAQRTMFKVEVLQDYSAIDDSPSLRAWKQGDRQLSVELAARDKDIIAWRKLCLASPADITRLHIIQEPLTKYLAWEIEVTYKKSLLKSGAEHVQLVQAQSVGDIQLPEGDFWIFDDSQVLEWMYDTDGFIVGGKAWLEGDDITRFLKLKKELLAKAVKLNSSP